MMRRELRKRKKKTHRKNVIRKKRSRQEWNQFKIAIANNREKTREKNK